MHPTFFAVEMLSWQYGSRALKEVTAFYAAHAASTKQQFTSIQTIDPRALPTHRGAVFCSTCIPRLCVVCCLVESVHRMLRTMQQFDMQTNAMPSTY
jgi:hypothetical protein